MNTENNKYRLLIEKLPDAFAYHQIVTNSEGKPTDYIFLDINSAFSEMTGLSKEQVIGKKVTEVHLQIENSDFDWISVYGDMALTGKSVRFEQYFDISDRWYAVTAYSDEPGHFAVFFRDITDSKEAEQGLTNLKALLENSKDAVGISTPHGHHYYQNKAFSELFGTVGERSPESLYVNKKTCEEIYRTIMSGKAWEGEVKMYAKDGQVLDILIQAFPSKNDNGNITGLVGIHTDISKHKRVENELRKSEEKYRLLADNASDVIWTTDLDLNYTYISPSEERISGYTAEERMSMSVHDTLTPFSLERVLQVLQEELELEAAGVADPSRTRIIEAEEYCKDGSTLCTEIKASFLRDKQGHVYGILGITRDISDRKKIEEALKANEERYRLLVENIGDLIFSVTDQGVFTYISPNSEAILGYKASEIIGKRFIEFVHPDYTNIINLKLQEVIKNYRESSGKFTKQVTVEYLAKHKSGYSIWISAKNTILKAINGGYEIVVVARDITEQKKYEAALQESEEKHRRLFETMSQGVIYQAADGKIISANPAAERILGLSLEQMQGKTSMDPRWQMIEEDGTEVPATEHPVMIALRTGKVVGPVTRGVFHPVKNAHIWMNITATPLFQPGETEPFQTYATFEDITEHRQAEQMLQKSEERFQRMLTLIPDMISVQDPDMNIIYSNWNGFGAVPEEKRVLHTKCYQTYRGLDDICPDCQAVTVLQTGKTIQKEVELSEGQWVDLRVLPILGHDGEVELVVEWIRDITNRKQSEEALRQSEERYRVLVENAQEIIVVIQDQLIKYANPMASKLLGYTSEEYLFKSFVDYIHPDDRDIVLENYLRGIKGDPAANKYECRLIDKKGEVRWVKVSADWIYWEGNPAALNLLSDITERKEAEIKIKESEEKFRTLFDQNILSFCLHDFEGNIIDVNNQTCLQLGYSYEELMDMSVFDFIYTKEKGGYWTKEKLLNLFKQMDVGERTTVEDIHQQKDGTISYVEVSTGVIRYNNKNIIMALIKDITERKIAEEKIMHLSFHDALTGLCNRAFLNEELKRLDTSNQLPISIIMVDLNGLKLVNDAYGHETGDEMLKSAAEIINKSCRREDIVGRWGGDEFVILLPQTPVEEEEKIRRRIKDNCRGVNVKGVPVSLAVGHGTKESAEKSLQAVLKEAEDSMYKQKLSEQKSVRSSVLNTLLKTLQAKSYETEEHTMRMVNIGWKIGEKIGLVDTELSRLNLVITLHDIGKINIHETTLTKKGPLTDEEWEIIKTHPEIGYRITRASEEFSHVSEDILAHHERWDGKGYPRGLKEKEIPLLARITAIADAYDVMSNGRPYKKPMPRDEIILEFKRCAGKQFDPELTEVFIEVFKNQLEA